MKMRAEQSYAFWMILTRRANAVELKRSIFLSILLASPLCLVPGGLWAAEQEAEQSVEQVVAPAEEPRNETREDYEQASYQLAKKNWSDAAIVLKSILKREPSNLNASYDLARALVYLGRREEALAVLTRAASLHKKKAVQAEILSRITVISRIFVTNANFQTFQEGMTLLRAQKLRAAQQKFERALRQEPDNLEVLLRLGQTLLLEGDVDSAAEQLRSAKRLNSNEAEARLWLGRALFLRGERTEAALELEFARQQLPSSDLAPAWLAELRASSGGAQQQDEAIKLLQDHVAKHPFHLKSLFALARLKYNAGRNNREKLWAARRDLQLLLSRWGNYTATRGDAFGLELSRSAEPYQTEFLGDVKRQLALIENRLEELSGPRPS